MSKALDAHLAQFKGKMVPLELAVEYIFNNHEHREEDGKPVVESLPLEKFLIDSAVELGPNLQING